MPELATNFGQYARQGKELLKGTVVITLGVVVFMGIIVTPLPTWLLDIMLIVNFAAAVMMLMGTMYLTNPLQMSSFPSVLLILTFYRLALSVATTRLILGSEDQTLSKAGHMVRAFGEVVAGSNAVVGAVIFLIFIVIQFVVITKGSTRISEVAARFTLDALPGKQMAIDADLNAGLITEHEARTRRANLSREADFYGAMDGASKWVRGDAVAGLIITIINIAGGFVIGMLMRGLSAQEALALYSRLTIGDGLVTQVPAVVIAVASGLIVTRSASTDQNLAKEILSQIVMKRFAAVSAAGVIGLLGLALFPWYWALPLSGVLGWLGFHVMKGEEAAVVHARESAEAEQRAEKKAPEKVDRLLKVDPMGLEVGYGLIPLVDAAQGGDLLNRVAGIRRQMALDLGVVVPPVRIRDNIELEPNQYVVKIRDVEVGRGTAMPDRLLAVNSSQSEERLEGTPTTDPSFGMPAVWITPALKDRAVRAGYMVVDATTVIATHLTEVIKRNADRVLTREEVAHLMDKLKETSPKLVEEVHPKMLSAGEIQKVLQALLRENVSIRDLETVVETLADYAPRTKEVETLVEFVRAALARQLCAQHAVGGRLHTATLDPAIEDAILTATQRTDYGSVINLPPARLRQIQNAVGDAVGRLAEAGHLPILLTSPLVRPQVRRIMEIDMPALTVLSLNEIVSGVEVESVAMAQVK
jgi:flagellar biosynthesis protein FlhA